MKIPLIAFGILVALIAVMLFGAVGLSRLVRWLGWSQDVLAAFGVACLFMAGICLCAWRFGEMESNEREILAWARPKRNLDSAQADAPSSNAGLNTRSVPMPPNTGKPL